MEWLSFIVEMTKALAWPVAIVLIVFLFKSEILKLLPRLKKLKHKDTEVEFSERVVELAKEIETTGELLHPPKPDDALSGEYEFLMRLAEYSPRSAVIEAFMTVEKAADRMLEKEFPDEYRKGLIAGKRFKLLSKMLDHQSLYELKELRNLRNKAAHDEEFSLHGIPIEAYVDIALTLARRLVQRTEPVAESEFGGLTR